MTFISATLRNDSQEVVIEGNKSISKRKEGASAQKSIIITGFRKQIALFRIWAGVLNFLIFKYKNPIRIIKIVKRVLDLRNRYTFDKSYKKLAHVDGRYFFNLNNNGWPAKHFYRIIDIEARTVLFNDVTNLENLRMVLIAFTKKCALQCEHCYEGDELNKKETLTLGDHKKILKKLQAAGISLFHFGGGDPMNRVNELVELIESAEKTADFWIYTSGFNFTEFNAMRLKRAGLTGVSISLDHFEPALHNKFRKNSDAFNWVETAAKNAAKAKLVITLTICVTREFCTIDNLLCYVKLAKKLGASIVQLLEPRAVGNYAGQDVCLEKHHEQILEEFFIMMSNDAKYKDLPIVLYPGYIQRKEGCAGAGSKFLYIDTDGRINSCPFCRNKKGSILDDDHEQYITNLKNEGCAKFSTLN